MINPSSFGWIEKFFWEQKEFILPKSEEFFYDEIRKTGFIYGHIIKLNTSFPIDISQWKEDEISKVALLKTLFDLYHFSTNNSNPELFVPKVLEFYNQMTQKGFGILNKLIPSNPYSKLENLINERVQTNKDIISKNFSHIITNALLFIDVLAFHHYLKRGKIPEKYLKTIEEIIVNLVSLSLQVKTVKSQHDDLLIKLFQASVRYTKFSIVNQQNLDNLPLDFLTINLEKYYFLDLVCIALWTDGKMDNEEHYFLYKLSEKFGLSNQFTENTITNTTSFINTHKSQIQYFNYSNPVKHFYDQTSFGVQLLIKRNKKRLIKEISKSKELMYLLAKSTAKDLSPEEKKKVKKQLLDICKSIPSLTIFLLPGGGLLLPILIKFIPQIVPSAFNENLDDQ